MHDCVFFFCRSRYGQGNLEGNRFKAHINGTLEIRNIQVGDQGTYLCVVSNVAGRDEDQVRIDVKGEGPQSLDFCGFVLLDVLNLCTPPPRTHFNCHKTDGHESHPWR